MTDTDTDMADTDTYATKTGGNDYTRVGGHAPYARASTDVVCGDLIILHKHLRWDEFPNYEVDSGRIEDVEKSEESFGLYASFSYIVYIVWQEIIYQISIKCCIELDNRHIVRGKVEISCLVVDS